MKRILILGATSAIAEATARKFAARGDALFLAARNEHALAAIAGDLRLRGATFVGSGPFDALNSSGFSPLVTTALKELGGLDEVLIAHGTLSNQSACEASVDVLQDEFVINAVSVMAMSQILACILSSQRRGVIAVISSVAGDRGRQSNYIYGAAKAALGTYLSGLRQQLYRKGVSVVTIKPGFVKTPMTAEFRKGMLWVTPERVATDIVRAMDRGSGVVYTPWFWRPIMAVVRFIPEVVFKRIRL
jgi:decaprenylphospho-beta-D-erythro-pentofuranosid-2-ulose 2-reductase